MRCERLGSLVLVLGLTLSGCGLGDLDQWGFGDAFTDEEWDEFYQWCEDHKVRPSSSCGGMADLIEISANEFGVNEDCVVRASKRSLTAQGEAAEEDARSALENCAPDD